MCISAVSPLPQYSASPSLLQTHDCLFLFTITPFYPLPLRLNNPSPHASHLWVFESFRARFRCPLFWLPQLEQKSFNGLPWHPEVVLTTALTNIEMTVYPGVSFTELCSAWGRDHVLLTGVYLAPAIGSGLDTICWMNKNFMFAFYYIFCGVSFDWCLIISPYVVWPPPSLLPSTFSPAFHSLSSLHPFPNIYWALTICQ